MENKKMFWEYSYSIGMFLKKIFGDNYERFYSMSGSGIYNLVKQDGKLYEVKLTQGKSMVENSDKRTTDKTKNDIMDAIVSNLKNDYTRKDKFITFKYDGYIFKFELVKKMSKPV